MKHVDKAFFTAFTQNSVWVQVYPSDTYKKFGRVIDAFPQGVMVEITKADYQSDYVVGSVYFIPMTRAFLRFTSQKEAM